MKATDLLSKSVEDLKKELLELRKEQFNLRMQRGTGQAVGSHQIKNARRDIARIKTVIKQIQAPAKSDAKGAK